jgi:hypothetical protein
MVSRMTYRVGRLETRSNVRTVACPCCGEIDLKRGTGRWKGPGVLLPDDDGTSLCFCKVCARTFRARLTPLESGGYSVAGAEPATFPV